MKKLEITTRTDITKILVETSSLQNWTLMNYETLK